MKNLVHVLVWLGFVIGLFGLYWVMKAAEADESTLVGLSIEFIGLVLVLAAIWLKKKHRISLK